MTDPVRLVREGNILGINPWQPTLAAELTNRRREVDRVKRTATVHEEPLFSVLESGSALCYGGLYHRVEQFLRQAGIPTVTENHQPPPPDVDFSRLEDVTFRFVQEEVIALICCAGRGQIKAPTAFGKTFIIECLARLYKGVSNMLVISEKSAVVKSIAERVHKASPTSKVWSVTGTAGFKPADVVVCGTRALHKIPAEWPDLVVFDEVHSAAAPQTSSELAKFGHARMFGLSATPDGRSDGSELVTEALFGPRICDISYAEAQEAGTVTPIKVFMVRVEGAEINKSTEAARDRWGIWCNRLRNEKIAQVIHSLPPGEQALILVNTTDHAFRLRQLLPEFKVAHAGLSKPRKNQLLKKGLVDIHEPLHVSIQGMLQDFRDGKIKGIIATQCLREGIDLQKLRVVVRSDGKRGKIPSIQMGGRLSRISDGKSHGILVDFIDDFGKTFMGRSADRIRQYKAEGWEVVEEFPQFYKELKAS